ncbi:Uncharacterised protein [Vibrio cholerae]|nr:Uncharacterised protein [Vibrio cholerae]
MVWHGLIPVTFKHFSHGFGWVVCPTWQLCQLEPQPTNGIHFT